MDQSAAHAPYVRSLGRLEDEDLFQVEKRVAGLLEHPGWGVLMELVQKEKDTQTEMLVITQGRQPEAEIRGKLGFIRGIDETERAASAVLEIAKRKRVALEEQFAREARNGN